MKTKGKLNYQDCRIKSNLKQRSNFEGNIVRKRFLNVFPLLHFLTYFLGKLVREFWNLSYKINVWYIYTYIYIFFSWNGCFACRIRRWTTNRVTDMQRIVLINYLQTTCRVLISNIPLPYFSAHKEMTPHQFACLLQSFNCFQYKNDVSYF